MALKYPAFAPDYHSLFLAHLLLTGLPVPNERLHLLAELLQGTLVLLKCDLGVEGPGGSLYMGAHTGSTWSY